MPLDALTATAALPAMAWLPAIAFALCAVLASAARRQDPWRWALVASSAAVAAATLTLGMYLVHGTLATTCPAAMHAGGIDLLDCGVRIDFASAAVLLLVSFIGWVIVSYSRTYLDGDANPHGFVARLAWTLVGVCTVVVTNNLLVLVLAWIATSVALHGLLTWYPERRPALLAAHKKFIASRVADACLLAAVALLAQAFGTLAIDELGARTTADALPHGAHAAVVLLAIAAALKCAQLPAHGWLIQVMEAPTPVSALLHAGVVNLGGFVLIRLAALVAEVPAAQALLVLVGLATAVLASLVMLTRISVKVMLAWSTCAQMGFMLMQCGLGAYELALLHLLAHSLYKAHAFLGAGSMVESTRAARLHAHAPLPFGVRLRGIAASVTIVGLAAVTWNALVPAQAVDALTFAVTWIVALAAAPLLAVGASGAASGATALAKLRQALPAAAQVFALAVLYFALHALFAHAMPQVTHTGTLQLLLVASVVAAFTVLAVLQAWLLAAPDSSLARALRPWFYAGLHLDELFTRATFRLWPVRATAAPSSAFVPSSRES